MEVEKDAIQRQFDRFERALGELSEVVADGLLSNSWTANEYVTILSCVNFFLARGFTLEEARTLAKAWDKDHSGMIRARQIAHARKGA